MPTLAESVDRYIIEGVLGEGGMGRVYRAYDPRLLRRVALKVLLTDPNERAAHPDAAARMLREARAAAAFNHPNVVAIYDVGEVDGSPYIAMELVLGETLRQRAARATLAEKIEWLVAVARGLGAAHRVGLVHRDIKPDNIMITSDGVAKVLDFGIARQVASDGGALDVTIPAATPDYAAITRNSAIVGTPRYMAPEQLTLQSLDGRADQFAWGVTAFEVLSGALPWPKAANGPYLVASILSGAVPLLRDVVPEIDPRVSEAVARALAKKREERFASMEELVAAVTTPSGVHTGPVAIASSPGVAALTPGFATTPLWLARKPLRRAVIAAVAVAMAGEVAATRMLWPRSPALRHEPAPAALAPVPRSDRAPSDPAAVGYEAGAQAVENAHDVPAAK